MNKKNYPDSVRFLLCEDIRQELGNKLSILGLFVGDDIVIKGEKEGQVIPSLAILAIFSGGVGEFQVSTKLYRHSRSEPILDLSKYQIIEKKGENITSAIKVAPFKIEEFGEYTAVWNFNGEKEYKYTFKIKNKT